MNGSTIPLIPNCSWHDEDWSEGDCDMDDESTFKMEVEFHFIGMASTIIKPTATYNF